MARMPPVYLAQRDFPVGDIAANRAALLEAAQQADRQNAVAAISPELALSGYCPDDMLYDSSFMDSVERALASLAAEVPSSPPMLVGAPWRENGRMFNALVLLRGGKIDAVYKKVFLPNYSVFDERRYFDSGDDPPLMFEAGGNRFAVLICADVWERSLAERVAEQGADFVLAANASPFYAGKHAERLTAAGDFSRRSRAGMYYCNLAGAQDELVFDGASFALNSDGHLMWQAPAFAPACGVPATCRSNGEASAEPSISHAPYPEEMDAVYAALLAGVRDYAAKTGFSGAVLGLSGGVDSALAAALAADAMGGANVLSVMMPSRYTSQASLEDAAAIAENLGSEILTISIDPLMDAVQTSLAPHLRARDGDVTMENIQARLRGQIVMALSNNRGLLPLATGNKSELACGYATLYGDMCGGYAPLKDVSKTRVWALAAHRNRGGEVIPRRVIERPPSAELRDNQTDQQTLPPYADIDSAIAAHVEGRRPHREWAPALGESMASRFLDLLAGGEHKRRQGAIGPKITSRAFGRDWRMPVANQFRHDGRH